MILNMQSVVWAVGDRVSDVTIKLLQVSPQSQAPLLLGVEISYLPVADLAVGRAVLGQLAATLAERVNAAAATLGQPRGECVCVCVCARARGHTHGCACCAGWPRLRRSAAVSPSLLAPR